MYEVNYLIGLGVKEKKEVFVGIIKNKKNCILNPITKVKTYAQFSNRCGMANVITFSDRIGGNVWFLLQVTRFVDGYLCSNDIVNVLGNPIIDRVCKVISNDESVFIPESYNCTVDGVVLSQTRPYHFIYDQMVNVFDLVESEDIPYSSFFIDDTVFFNRVVGNKFKIKKEKGCYLFPTIQPHRYHGPVADSFHKKIMERCKTYKYDADFVLWFGITGQKRSWIEQVEGCVEIVKRLLNDYETITLVVDGWTAYCDESLVTLEDRYVLEEIEQKLLSFKNVDVISLIDTDYDTKIAYSKNIDFFIANSGSGSVVPQMFACKKGVVHGKLRTFSKNYGESVKVVPQKKMISENSGTVMLDSYSFHWSVIYNLLLELGCKGHFVEEKKTSPSSKLIFSDVSFNEKHEPAEILRDLALRYEKIGDFKTALSLMEKALEQRPKGPLIKSKIEEYKKRLS